MSGRAFARTVGRALRRWGHPSLGHCDPRSFHPLFLDEALYVHPVRIILLLTSSFGAGQAVEPELMISEHHAGVASPVALNFLVATSMADLPFDDGLTS